MESALQFAITRLLTRGYQIISESDIFQLSLLPAGHFHFDYLYVNLRGAQVAMPHQWEVLNGQVREMC